MNAIKILLTIILMFALRNLYHKMFRVVYFDAVTAIFREFAICFLISGIIVFGGFSKIGSMFTPNEKDPGFYGTYHNLALLEGGDSDTFIILSGGDDKKDGKMRVIGSSIGVGNLPWIDIDMETEVPKKKTFTCSDDTCHITLTITADPKKHTLEVVQETASDGARFPFTGKYVDDDSWEEMRDQVNTAKEVATAAQTPNKWMDDYFDDYMLRAYLQGESGTLPAVIFVHDSNNPDYFTFDYCVKTDDIEALGRYEIPYPLGDVEAGHISYMSEDGPITFEIQGYSDGGYTEVVITEFPDPMFIGTYISVAYLDDMPTPSNDDAIMPDVDKPSDYSPPISYDSTNNDGQNESFTYTDAPVEEPEEMPEYLPEEAPRSWDGVYTCTSDGPDGTKTLTITQTSDSTLSISLYHLYADGREDTLDIVADIGTYNRDQYFASYTDTKTLYFELLDNSTVDVAQIGIYPDVDLEYFGVYTSGESGT